MSLHLALPPGVHGFVFSPLGSQASSFAGFPPSVAWTHSPVILSSLLSFLQVGSFCKPFLAYQWGPGGSRPRHGGSSCCHQATNTLGLSWFPGPLFPLQIPLLADMKALFSMVWAQPAGRQRGQKGHLKGWAWRRGPQVPPQPHCSTP